MTNTSRRSILALAASVPVAAAATRASAQIAGGPGTQALGSGRAALITGSSRGIGAATAKRLARDGYAVTINYLTRQDRAAEVVREIEAAGGRAIAHQADVADPTAVRGLFDTHDQAFGGVDVVVSNAGIMNVGSFAEMTDEAFDRMIATNIKGGFNVFREASRRIRDGGRIVALSSTAFTQKRATHGPYNATKVAQEMYAGSLAKELAGRRVSVNAVAPGATNTDMLNAPPAAREQLGQMVPYGRVGEADDIANAIAALCSADGEWINGQVVLTNGGLF